ncbi:hypothetical protein EV182_001132 [Spiromyces aspiralis]|uniref:Uncharacterized protein n=1 Tax=Spiromyces aspiralis TaxID=68401 RepID=A0ACC1HTH9_9FUNG|nr:hypothetical protein EV182_001132 [Spiromyces aspiralis]
MPNGEPVKKRPMGLKARTAQKRRAESAGEPQTANPETATVILKNPAGGEDATEVDEVEAIYGNAEDALASGDTEQAIPLLRGTVHECDRILRNHYQSAGDSLPPLPSKFYYVYGMALFSLGELSVPDDAAEYFGLGRERLEQALEEYNARESGGGGREFKFKILSGIAKATLSQARFISRDRTFGSEITKAATSATELFNEALACIAAENDAKYFEEVLVVPDLMFAFVEANIEVKELQAAVDWGIGKLKDVVGKGQRLGEVYYQLARGTWVLASHYLEQQDEETGDVPEQATVQKLLAQGTP